MTLVGTNTWESEATVPYDTGTPEEFDIDLRAGQIDPWTAAGLTAEWFHDLELVNGSGI